MIRRHALAAVMVGALAAFPSGGEAASRLYPYAGIVVRFEADADRSPRRLTLAQGGVAVSLGKIAPSVVVRAGEGRAEMELGVRYSFR